MIRPVTSSGQLAVSTAASVVGYPCLLHGFVITPGAADATLTIYDNSAGAASGTILASYIVKASTASVNIIYNNPVVASNGLAYVLAGAAAVAYVYFSPGD